MPNNDTPASPLDRMGRDLSRTLLHGGRPADTNAIVRPAAVQTGQQIPVDLPAGDATFAFTVEDTDTPVIVDHARAAITDQFMKDAIGKADYLSLEVDSGIPTWVFQQRQYGLANPPADSDSIQIGTQIVARLPFSVLQEVSNASFAGKFVDSYASVWSVDRVTQQGTRMPLAQWQPAIFLRFRLDPVKPKPAGIPEGMQVYALLDIPEGDRWFLDQLGLLPGNSAAQPVTIASISFALETKDNKGRVQPRTPVMEWSIARTNLSQESRPVKAEVLFESEVPAPRPFPYVVLSGDAGQNEDALRMLSMATITNSGGYFFGATTTAADAQSLIVSVLIGAQQDPDPSHADSGMLPLAANAIAVASETQPDTVRFNGAEQVEIKPASQIGTVSFGWTRKVSTMPATDEDKFGYGTLSIVDYTASDGAEQSVPCPVPVISPLGAQPGEPFEQPGSAMNAAMRLAPSTATPTNLATADTELHYYRGTVTCYDKLAGQSPWFRLNDANKRQITVTPGFRDIFGNHFDALQGPAITRRMFYTDAVVSPADWPGLRFAVYPELRDSKGFFTVELILSPGLTSDGKTRLKEISTQLRGVDADVSVSLLADPLVVGNCDLNASTIADQIDKWTVGATSNPVVTLGRFACDGTVTDMRQFNPRVEIARRNPDYLPAASDLPQVSWLATLILDKITSVRFPIAVQASAAPPVGSTERHDEYHEVVQNLQTVVASGRDFQIGLLRDHLNRHEIWLIPNLLFPTAPSGDAAAAWAFATPCPLRNQPGNESYQTDVTKIDMGVPDFTGKSTSAQQWKKYNLPLVSGVAIDQDFDELGRVALRMIEEETADLGQLMPRTSAALMRELLAVREGIADELATFNVSKTGTSAGFVVPLLASGAAADFDAEAITRIARDAFLGDLTAFYAVSTVVQMPVQPGSEKIQTFQGVIDTRLDPAAPPNPKGPSFSDVLLSGGDPKVTFLCDAAPGTTSVPPLPAMNVSISHVQLPLPDAPPGASPFNQGPWIELAAPYILRWTLPKDPIPVAVRAVPSKPILESTMADLPRLGTSNSDGTYTVDASTVDRLAKWGWSFAFSLVNSVPQDTVHVKVQYPMPTPNIFSGEAGTASDDWAPKSLLQVLYVLKQLRDHWGDVAIKDRLSILNDLTQYLLQFLSPGPPHNPPVPNLAADGNGPIDSFAIEAPPALGHSRDSLTVMQDIQVTWTSASKGAARLDRATVSAPGESRNNSACLTSPRPLRSYTLSLVLTRNEFFFGQDANDLVIYQCPPVQWPGRCPAQNLWGKLGGTLVFDRKGLQLRDALEAFFAGLLQGSDLTRLNLEAGISVAWTKRAMTAITPFALLPIDLRPADGTANSLANFVYGQCVLLLGENAPAPGEVDSSRIRVRVKISAQDTDASQGTAVILEVPAIDFAL